MLAGCARLHGRVALVTGGSRADAATADGVVAEIVARGGSARAQGADLRAREACAELVASVAAQEGRLDILVNNAGVAVLGDALDMPVERLEEAMRLALHAPLWCTQAAAAALAAHGCGRVINVSSIGALGTAVAGLAPYAVAKAALNMLTKRLAFELGPRGVTVNAVCPGLIDTAMADATAALPEFEAMRRDAARTTILGRVGLPVDIAGVAAFLASDDAAFLTGQCLSVDGGRKDLLSRSG